MAQDKTANAYTNKFFNADFFKGMTPANGLFSFDFGSVMETQRKNIEAITEANKVFTENLQLAAKLQAKIMTQMIEDNTTIAQQIMADGTPEEKVSRQADIVRNAYERSVSEISELADLVSKSNRESGEIINKRVTASLSEFKKTIDKTKEKQAA